MIDIELVLRKERYKEQCTARARHYLQDKDIEHALHLMLFEKDMNADEIKAAADLIIGMEEH